MPVILIINPSIIFYHIILGKLLSKSYKLSMSNVSILITLSLHGCSWHAYLRTPSTFRHNAHLGVFLLNMKFYHYHVHILELQANKSLIFWVFKSKTCTPTKILIIVHASNTFCCCSILMLVTSESVSLKSLILVVNLKVLWVFLSLWIACLWIIVSSNLLLAHYESNWLWYHDQEQLYFHKT